MTTTEFIITTSYSILSIIMYALVAYIIIRNKKLFFGSYFNIILVDSAVNVCTYFNSLITLRLPRITCKDCILAPLMSKVPGLNFFGCMYFHLAYVQYLMALSLIFNRFTAVLFPLEYNARLFLPLIMFNFLGPFPFTYPWLTSTVSLEYVEQTDCFVLTSLPDVYPVVNLFIIPSMAVITTLCTVLTIATFVVYNSRAHSPDDAVEKRLLIYSVLYFLVQLFAAFVVGAMLSGGTWNIPILTTVGEFLLPYVADALTFSSPYLLFSCSRVLRALLKKMFLGNRSKHNKVSPITR